MDDELHDLTPGPGTGLPDDDPTVRAFRGALGGGSRRSADPRAALAGIERRARVQQRRRFAGTTALAVAGLAVVVAVTPLALGGRGDQRDLAGAAASPSSTPPDDQQLSTPAAATPLGAQDLLRAGDVTAFGAGTGAAAVSSGPEDVTADPLTGGLCTTEVVEGAAPQSAWRSDFAPAGVSPADVTVYEGASERVLRWGSQADADAYRLGVQALADGCVAQGGTVEGIGPWTALDATGLTPPGGTALLHAAPGGTGGYEVSVLLTSGDTAVALSAVLDAPTARAAADLLTPTALAAAERAFAGSSTPIATGGAPSGAAPTDPATTDDSLAAS